MQYSLANVILRRRFSVEDIQPDAVPDPVVIGLNSRFVVERDDQLTGKFVPATVSLRLRDGTTRAMVADVIPGTPDRPLSGEQIEQKAMNCFIRGPMALSKQRAEALINRLKCLDDLHRMSDCLVA